MECPFKVGDKIVELDPHGGAVWTVSGVRKHEYGQWNIMLEEFLLSEEWFWVGYFRIQTPLDEVLT